MDAWVYLAHGHVFANAQTGNVVLLAIHLTAGEWDYAASVLPSITAFIAGLVLSRLAGARLKTAGLNSRNVRLLAECLLLLVLALIVRRLEDEVTTAFVGFIAAVQITSLSHIGPARFNTGMTTGNLRSAVTAIVAVFVSPDAREDRYRARTLAWICLAFPMGAIAGGLFSRWLGDGTVFVVAGLVACAVLVMWRTPDPPQDP